MGLHIVELVFEVEEEFGVQIHQEEMVNLVTVGELYELILAHRSEPDSKPDQGKKNSQPDKEKETETNNRCLTSASLYQLRRSISFGPMSIADFGRAFADRVVGRFDLDAVSIFVRSQENADIINSVLAALA